MSKAQLLQNTSPCITNISRSALPPLEVISSLSCKHPQAEKELRFHLCTISTRNAVSQISTWRFKVSRRLSICATKVHQSKQPVVIGSRDGIY